MAKTITIENSNLKLTNNEDSDLNLFGLVLDYNHMDILAGNTAQRPSSPQAGMMRFNAQTSGFEGYNGNSWVTISQ